MKPWTLLQSSQSSSCISSQKSLLVGFVRFVGVVAGFGGGVSGTRCCVSGADGKRVVPSTTGFPSGVGNLPIKHALPAGGIEGGAFVGRTLHAGGCAVPDASSGEDWM